jgi:hypothetical protein
MDWFIELRTARKLSHPLCCSLISENIVSRLSEQLQEALSSLFKDADDDKISKDDPSYTFVVAYAHLEKRRQQASYGDVDEVKELQRSCIIFISVFDLILVYLKMVILYLMTVIVNYIIILET